jgi:hypothetical protein
MRPRISIFQLVELTTIVAITIAIPRLMVQHLATFFWMPMAVLIWGIIGGNYLTFRWSRSRGFWTLFGLANLWTIGLTLPVLLWCTIEVMDSLAISAGITSLVVAVGYLMRRYSTRRVELRT